MATVNGTIAAGADDVQFYDDGGWGLAGTATAIYYGWWGNNPDLGSVRFVLDGAIPSGATIDSAVVGLYGSDSDDVSEFWACVSEDDDAPQVVDVSDRPAWADGGDITTYPTTREGTGAIHWTGFSWSLAGYNNLTVTGLVQHLVDTYGGLASGAHINFFFCGDEEEGNQENSFLAYENTTNKPILTITYTPAVAGMTNDIVMIFEC